MDSYLELQRRKILSGNARGSSYGQQSVVAVREPSRLRDVSTNEDSRLREMEEQVQKLVERLAAVESKAAATSSTKDHDTDLKAQPRAHHRSASGLSTSSRISAVEPPIPELDEAPGETSEASSFPFHTGIGSNTGRMEEFTPKRLWAMWQQYRSNVDPLIKIVHISAVQHLFLATEDESKHFTPDAESLKFAICFAAAASLETPSGQATSCPTNKALLHTYATRVEWSLTRSRFMSEPTVAAVQALTMYLLTGQRFLSRDYAWSLLSILVRIAVKLKLHQDPDNQGLTFLECEYRRRLWWHICTLDARIAELNDTDPLIYERRCSVRFPSSIQDSDLESVHDIDAKRDCTEHNADTFGNVLRFEITYYLRTILFSEEFMEENGFPILPVDGKLSVIEYLEKILEEKYLRACDCSSSTCRLAIASSKITVARLKLTAILHDRSLQLGKDEMDEVLTNSAVILENLRTVREDPSLSRWAWLTTPQAEWDAAAICLSALLLMHSKTKAVTRAWTALTLFFVEWKESSHDPALYKRWIRLEGLKMKAEAVQSSQSNGESASGSSLGGYVPYHPNATAQTPVSKTPTTLMTPSSPSTNGGVGSHVGNISNKSPASARSTSFGELDWPFPKETLHEHAAFDIRSFALMF
ncbi:hypothetical protein CERZMDRAFT_87724 [Cercospora zeae-maydis SCOH1-5]|uniref:Xylanolytic transcriptional activator regulatory domain-containing protein n=1 Tax=Cercospora zeae-maydis SCOH1-5 TaxID=717836 RepID=A0A6A6F3G5_9PEZI|nr:hypothetical protein CERZMDRAFT_87724 [Cercospora zeae-maydis SCOH1-5]